MTYERVASYLRDYERALESVIDEVDIVFGHHASISAIATANTANRAGKPYALFLHGTGIEPRHDGMYDDRVDLLPGKEEDYCSPRMSSLMTRVRGFHGDGYAVWEEEDYCSPPLAQERAAALDEFFDDLEVTVVERGEGWAGIEELPRLVPQLPGRSFPE